MTSAASPSEFDGIPFDNSYARLPQPFGAPMQPVPVAAPSLIALNDALAKSLGLDPAALRSEAGVEWLAGNRPAAGAEPLAMAYAGHQFGHFVPSLGDGRALLLGEVVDRDGARLDLHLKGSGPTPFSRGGDGRSSIGPVVREYLAAEAMAALGIPTTRALAAVATGESVVRAQTEPGGILLRVGRGHVRVGTFEYFARRGDTEALRILTDYVVKRLYPELAGAESPPLALLEAVIERTAALVARWMCVGFIHGVMNTDNTSVAGETIDFGPFGYIDEFDPSTCYSSIDRHGRYAWNQQPTIAHWNMARLGECLLPLLADSPEQAVERANPVLETFPDRYQRHFNAGLAAKIGLEDDQDAAALALDLLERMHRNTADFTLTFRGLCALEDDVGDGDVAVRARFDNPEAFDAWAATWRRRLRAVGRDPAERQAAMRRTNPALVLRNHLAQRAVDAAIEQLDFEPMHTLHRALATPFEEPLDHPELARPPRPDERVLKTFCGT